jgi:hypothetical protein
MSDARWLDTEVRWGRGTRGVFMFLNRGASNVGVTPFEGSAIGQDAARNPTIAAACDLLWHRGTKSLAGEGSNCAELW